MNIKQRIKSILDRVTCKQNRRNADECRNGSCTIPDSELAAEEVVRGEVFPPTVKKRANTEKKPASKRTRPTNADYTMIDNGNDTCDTHKS